MTLCYRLIGALLLCTAVSCSWSPAPAPAPEPAPIPRPDNPFPAVAPAPAPTPNPAPTPTPAPDTTGVIDTSLIYPVQSDSPFILVASPQASVRISRDEGPVRVRGVFAGGPAVVETRVLTGKYIAFVEPTAGASGKVELLFIPTGLKVESQISRTLVRIGNGPQPPPTPPTPPGPAPIPAPTGFRVIIAYKTNANNDANQLAVINSTKVREYLMRKCAKGTDGTPEFRIWDTEITVTDKESATLRDLWTTAKPGLSKPPEVIIAVDGAAKIYPLPPTENELLTLLKSKGGD